jgi:hypothetical protein
MNLMLNGIEAIRDANGQVNVRSQLTEDNQVLGWIIDTGMGPPAGMIDNIVSTQIGLANRMLLDEQKMEDGKIDEGHRQSV